MKRTHPGRPPLTDDDKPPRVHVTLSAHAYDQAESIAKREGISVPEVMRRGLARALEDEDDDD